MKIQDALARLERAGSEHSRATEKLRQAVYAVASHLLDRLIEAGVDQELTTPAPIHIPSYPARGGNPELPVYLYYWGGPTLVWEEQGVETRLSHHGGEHDEIPRDIALDFARGVATGYLDRVAAWLEERALAAQEAAEKLAAQA